MGGLRIARLVHLVLPRVSFLSDVAMLAFI